MVSENNIQHPQMRVLSVQFSSVQSLSHVWLFVTPWTAGASLPITNSRSLLRLMSIESVMPSISSHWASLVAQLVKNPPAMQETWVDPWVGKIPWRRERLPTPVFWPGEFHGLYSPWGHKELDMTEWLSLYITDGHLYLIFMNFSQILLPFPRMCPIQCSVN